MRNWLRRAAVTLASAVRAANESETRFFFFYCELGIVWDGGGVIAGVGDFFEMG